MKKQEFIHKLSEVYPEWEEVLGNLPTPTHAGEFWVRCPNPDHVEKKASCSVNPDKGLFNCFGCGEAGSIQKFYQFLRGGDLENFTEVHPDFLPEKIEEAALYVKPPKGFMGRPAVRIARSASKAVRLVILRWAGQNGERAWKYCLPERTPQGVTLKDVSRDSARFVLLGVDAIGASAVEDTLMLVEGETDLDAVQEAGISAITWTCGVRSWKRKELRLFQEIKKLVKAAEITRLVVCFDNDKAGIREAAALASSLSEKFKEDGVDVVNLTEVLYSESEEGEDLQDLARNGEDLLARFEEALEDLEIKKSLEPWGFLKVPSGYRIEKTGVFFGASQLAPEAVWVSGLGRRPAGLDKVETYVEITTLRSGSFVVPFSELGQPQRLIEKLLEAGCPVDPSQKTKLSSFLVKLVAENTGEREFEKKSFSIVQSLGWTEQGFFYGTENLSGGADSVPSPEEGERALCEALKASGSKEEWQSAVLPIIKDFKSLGLRLALAASASSVLLEIVRAPGIVFNLASKTRSGKTEALRLVASFWGNPDRLPISWGATAVGFERRLAFLKNLPFFVDDAKKASSPEFIQEALYLISNGESKARGTVSGFDVSRTWRTNAVSTSESSLDLTSSGASLRLIEFFGAPMRIFNAGELEEAALVSSENFGFGGREFCQLVASSRELIRERYTELSKKLSSPSMTTQQRGVLKAWLPIIISAELLEDLGYFAKGQAVEIRKEAMRRISEDFEVVDPAAESFEVLREVFFREKKKAFLDLSGGKTPSDSDVEDAMEYGIILDDGVGFFSKALKELLRDEDISVRALVKAWKETGRLLPGQASIVQRKRFRTSSGYKSVSVYFFDRSQFEEK